MHGGNDEVKKEDGPEGREEITGRTEGEKVEKWERGERRGTGIRKKRSIRN